MIRMLHKKIKKSLSFQTLKINLVQIKIACLRKMLAVIINCRYVFVAKVFSHIKSNHI